MNKEEFEVVLLKPPDIDGAYFIVPFNVPEVYGTKAHVKVRGTIDGFPCDYFSFSRCRFSSFE